MPGLIHSLIIVTPTQDGTLDDYGHPVAGTPVEVAVSGLIQPKSAREMSQSNQAGAMIADHTIFLALQDLSAAAYIRYATDDGDRYQITGIRSFSFGGLAHLEVDARRVVGEALVAS